MKDDSVGCQRWKRAREFATALRRFTAFVCLSASAGIAATPGSAAAQGRPTLEIARESGPPINVTVSLDRGYAVVPLAVFEDLGWAVSEDGGAIEISAAGEIRITMRRASPFFRWDGVVLQLTDAPYRAREGTVIPLQFLTDFLPRRLPGLYDYEGARSRLRAGDLALLGEDLAVAGENENPAEASAGEVGADSTGVATNTGRAAIAPIIPTPEDEPIDDPSDEEPLDDSPDEDPRASASGEGLDDAAAADEISDSNTEEAVANAGPSVYDGARVVVIDAGHGGADPGAIGAGGIREKNVVLEIALRLEAALRTVPNLEVHMIRDGDDFVDLWDRGRIATEIKGERPGIFVSVHANSFPARREARGFETFFLSDARTEHERRVSAIENAPITMGRQTGDSEEVADVDFILRDLRNYDHAHWSQNLAGLVQEELGVVHPGPNRGVKQGVLAVLTNALMPSVLVEVGYLSNRDEAQLIAEPEFHQNSADAIAGAVERFFERYPPGSGTGAGASR